MKKHHCLLFFVCPFLALAQPYEEVAPKEMPKNEGKIIERSEEEEAFSFKEHILVHELQGIVFLEDVKKIGVWRKDFKGIEIDGKELIKNDEFYKKVCPFLGGPLSLKTLDDIDRAVTLFYKESGYPLVSVVVPAGQDISSGVLYVLIILGKRGAIEVEGIKYFSAEDLKKQITTKKGEVIREDKMLFDLFWLNSNPFRKIDIIYERGAEFGESDLLLKSNESFPLRIFGGYENSGAEVISIHRYLAGFNWGRAFGQNQQLNYQFVSAPNPQKWWSMAFTYDVPLPWRHTCSLFGNFSKAHPPIEGFFSQGKSWQFYFTYTIPLKILRHFQEEVVFAYQFKRTNNFLAYNKHRVFHHYIEISQFVLSYKNSLDEQLGRFSLELALTASPGNMTRYNKDRYFEQQFKRGDSTYAYVNMNLEHLFYLPKGFAWDTQVIGQLTSDVILPSEQEYFTGYLKVRGYHECELTADRGVLMRNELQTPPYALLKGDAYFLTFFDCCWAGGLHGYSKTTAKKLASCGAGVRYKLREYVSLRCDYGVELVAFNKKKHRKGLPHIGILAAF